MTVTDGIRRVGCVLSAAWLAIVEFGARLGLPDWRQPEQLLTHAALPVAAVWGLAWVIGRIRASQSPSPTRSNPGDNRWHFATILVLAIGLIGAYLAVDGARLFYDSNGVTRTIAYWAMIGAIAGFAAAAICRHALGLPLLVAALVAVAGIDWKYGADVWESHLMTQSYVKSVPLLNRIETGAEVSDQQIRDAQVGIYEPLLLAEATYRRNAEAIDKAYSGVLANLGIRELMSPRSLTTPSGLAAARTALATLRSSLDDYATGMDTIGQRDRAAMQAVLEKSPAQVRNRVGPGIASGVAQRAEMTRQVIQHERAMADAFTGIVDLLATHPGKYRLAPGTNQLQFADVDLLTRYNDHVRAAHDAAQWEKENLETLARESEALVKRRNQAAEK